MSAPDVPQTPALRRIIGLPALTLYGVSVIVGAGIYVALGQVVARAGESAPLSFLVAGAAAALIGLCYADLAGRWPEASGAAAFVGHGFGSKRAAQATGLVLTLAFVVSAASIASGASSYLAFFLPAPPPALIAGLVILFTLIAAAGVRESVSLAALLGLVEIGGLIAAAGAGLVVAPDWDASGVWPRDAQRWAGVGAGAFVAFFAFIGFEVLANMGEETRNARRTLPRAILLAVAISVVLYVGVALAAVLSDRSEAANPLLALFDGEAARWFALVGALAVANGVLVEIVMLSRLFYGLARRGEAPALLAVTSARTRTPLLATALAGALVLTTALALPFERLLVINNVLMLGVSCAVALALVRVRRDPAAPPAPVPAPRWAAPAAAAMTAALAGAELFARI